MALVWPISLPLGIVMQIRMDRIVRREIRMRKKGEALYKAFREACEAKRRGQIAKHEAAHSEKPKT